MGKETSIVTSWEDIDYNFYITFGAAVTLNFIGLLLSPVILLRNPKRNGMAVGANLMFIVSNWIQFGQQGLNCDGATHAIQFFMILGSLLEVLAPLTRTFPLLEKRLKKYMVGIIVLLVISEFTSVAGLGYDCNKVGSQFSYIRNNMYSEISSHCIGMVIYVISFRAIITLINSSEFTKENSRMKIVKTMSIWSIYFTVFVKIGCLIGYFSDGNGNNELEMALKSGLACAIILLSLFLEVSTKSNANSKNATSEERKASQAFKNEEKGIKSSKMHTAAIEEV